MDLKNAVAVCVISLFSATIVVLIARSLDDRAASRLEPQLAAIVEELQAIRQGGAIAAGTSAARDEAMTDGVLVYYFHSNARCPTCRSIESQAHDAVQTYFEPELSQREITWKIVNYEQPAGAAFVKQFGIEAPVVVLAKMKSGEIEKWKRLDEVWALVGDKPAFARLVRDEIAKILGRDAIAPSETKRVEKTEDAATDLPIPAPMADLPVP